jgi:hypothetical protein
LLGVNILEADYFRYAQIVTVATSAEAATQSTPQFWGFNQYR